VWFDECKIFKMKSLWMDDVAAGGRQQEEAEDRLKQETETDYQFTLNTGEHNFTARRISSSSSSSSGTNNNNCPIRMSSDSRLSGYSSSINEDKQTSAYKKKVSTTKQDLQEYCTKFGASRPHVSINYRPVKGKYRKEF